MTFGARSPEELETLLEDAFVLRDARALAPLFEPRALLVAGAAPVAARGREAIARSARALWARSCPYVADTRRVVQCQDLALVLGAQGTNVARRGADGDWRYAIWLLSKDEFVEEER